MGIGRMERVATDDEIGLGYCAECGVRGKVVFTVVDTEGAFTCCSECILAARGDAGLTR